MVEMKFFRDDEYVYINNPDGTTKRVAIEDFDNAISGEGGDGSGSCFIVNVSAEGNTTRLEKTWKEIHDAFNSGKFVNFVEIRETQLFTYWLAIMGTDGYTPPYYCELAYYDGELGSLVLRCATENDYPVITQG